VEAVGQKSVNAMGGRAVRVRAVMREGGQCVRGLWLCTSARVSESSSKSSSGGVEVEGFFLASCGEAAWGEGGSSGEGGTARTEDRQLSRE
jgi:hypothetical protein